MSSQFKAWRIKEFSEKVNSIIQKEYPEESIHQNTIATWFKELEDKAIHFVQRDNVRTDWKVFDESDLEIALFIARKRQKTSSQQAWNLQAIYDVVSKECNVRAFPMNYEFKLETVNVNDLLVKVKEEISNDIKEIIQSSYDNNQKTLEYIDVKNNINQKKSLIDLLEFQSEARKEALKEWTEQPDEIRYIKRLFRKEENWAERERFISETIEKKTLYWLNKKVSDIEEDQ